MAITNTATKGGTTTCTGKTEGICQFTCAQGFAVSDSSETKVTGSHPLLKSTTTCSPNGAVEPVFQLKFCNDIDECATSNGGCSAGAVCVNTPGSFYCGKPNTISELI
jgi:hypothetical protein